MVAQATQELGAVVGVHRRQHERQAGGHLVGRDRRRHRLVDLGQALGAERIGEADHRHPLLHQQVAQVARRERRQLQVEQLEPAAAIVPGGPRHGPGQGVGGGEGLLHLVVLRIDPIGERRVHRPKGRIEERVLVVRVRLQDPGDPIHVRSQVGAGRVVEGVGVAGGEGEPEQLGPEALVDVAVQVDRERRRHRDPARDQCLGHDGEVEAGVGGLGGGTAGRRVAHRPSPRAGPRGTGCGRRRRCPRCRRRSAGRSG